MFRQPGFLTIASRLCTWDISKGIVKTKKDIRHVSSWQ
jgi:hypothetical protein